MNLENLLADVTKLAYTVSAIIPQAGLVEGAAKIGTKVLEIIDDVSKVAPIDNQQQMQQARAELAAKVKTHAASTSSDLRG